MLPHVHGPCACCSQIHFDTSKFSDVIRLCWTLTHKLDGDSPFAEYAAHVNEAPGVLRVVVKGFNQMLQAPFVDVWCYVLRETSDTERHKWKDCFTTENVKQGAYRPQLVCTYRNHSWWLCRILTCRTSRVRCLVRARALLTGPDGIMSSELVVIFDNIDDLVETQRYSISTATSAEEPVVENLPPMDSQRHLFGPPKVPNDTKNAKKPAGDM